MVSVWNLFWQECDRNEKRNPGKSKRWYFSFQIFVLEVIIFFPCIITCIPPVWDPKSFPMMGDIWPFKPDHTCSHQSDRNPSLERHPSSIYISNPNSFIPDVARKTSIRLQNSLPPDSLTQIPLLWHVEIIQIAFRKRYITISWLVMSLPELRGRQTTVCIIWERI